MLLQVAPLSRLMGVQMILRRLNEHRLHNDHRVDFWPLLSGKLHQRSKIPAAREPWIRTRSVNLPFCATLEGG